MEEQNIIIKNQKQKGWNASKIEFVNPRIAVTLFSKNAHKNS